ncbi:MAG TPA: ABC transporter ATP-binding protein [Bacteroidia bacterium]|nr:ABC transporter ATP-binding protein [Bacteroidia bacterium]
MKLFSVFKYIKGYWNHAWTNIICNVLFSIFSLFSLVLVKPFLDLLFLHDEAFYKEVLQKGQPAFQPNGAYLNNAFTYHLSGLISSQGKLSALLFICIIIVLLTFFKNFFRYMAMYALAPIRNGVVRDLRNRLMDKVLHLQLSYFSNEKKGDIMSRITSDVSEIEWSIMQSLELVFREPLLIVISLVTLIMISPYLTLYVFLLLPAAGLLVALIGRSLKRNASKSKHVLGHLFTAMEETLSGLKIIKAFTGERFVSDKFKSINEDYTKISVRIYRKTDLTSPLTEVIVTAILMLIMFIGGKMVMGADGSLSASSFITYIIVASQIIPPVKQITQAYNSIQKGVASEERINKILHAENSITEINNPTEIKSFSQKIEFKNVSFAYNRGDSGHVLQHVNLIIPKGKTIALVGQSGSGKTTLTDMIARFYDCDEGEILFDDVNIKTASLKSVRNMLGMVSQEPILFNDTVFNNIAFGLENITEQQVIEAACIANAHDFITQMPEGYQTNVGDRGTKLSGGQRQRISIARAVLKNPPILILDEATSALDSENERMVQDALQKLMQNRTTVVIAHRLSTIVHADEIIVLEKGKIIERGTHKELLAQAGTYLKLYEMQTIK